MNDVTDANTKPWYTSKSVLGSIVAVLALGAGFAGYEIAAEDQARIVDAVLNVVALAGAMVALVGRVTATKRLT